MIIVCIEWRDKLSVMKKKPKIDLKSPQTASLRLQNAGIRRPTALRALRTLGIPPGWVGECFTAGKPAAPPPRDFYAEIAVEAGITREQAKKAVLMASYMPGLAERIALARAMGVAGYEPRVLLTGRHDGTSVLHRAKAPDASGGDVEREAREAQSMHHSLRVRNALRKLLPKWQFELNGVEGAVACYPPFRQTFPSRRKELAKVAVIESFNDLRFLVRNLKTSTFTPVAAAPRALQKDPRSLVGKRLRLSDSGYLTVSRCLHKELDKNEADYLDLWLEHRKVEVLRSSYGGYFVRVHTYDCPVALQSDDFILPA